LEVARLQVESDDDEEEGLTDAQQEEVSVATKHFTLISNGLMNSRIPPDL